MATNDPRNIVTSRARAIEWWSNVVKYPSQKEILCDKYYTNPQKHFISLTGREIEMIWKAELLKTESHNLNLKKNVDFEMLLETVKETIITLNTMKGTQYEKPNEGENLELFFNLLSKSSTFAHKAHKELKNLKQSSHGK